MKNDHVNFAADSCIPACSSIISFSALHGGIERFSRSDYGLTQICICWQASVVVLLLV